MMTQLTLEQAWGINRTDFSIAESNTTQTQNEANQAGNQLLDMQIETEMLNIIQWNARSLNDLKAEFLGQLASILNATVLCISELGHRRTIPGFRCVTASDLHTQTGIFVENTIQTDTITDTRLFHYQARIMGEGIIIHGRFRTFIILHIYIPPDASSRQREAYWNQIQSLIRDQDPEIPLIICGDLNTKSPLFCDAHNREPHSYFENFVNHNNLEIMNNGLPTRNDNALDACLANHKAAETINSWNPIMEHISDHVPCLIETNFELQIPDARRKGFKPFAYINIKKSVAAIISWLQAKHLRPDHNLELITLWEEIQNNLRISTSWHRVTSFWNTELSKLKRQRNREYRCRLESNEAAERFHNLDKLFKQTFKKAKRKFQRTEVERLCRQDPTGAQAWTICKSLDVRMRTRKTKIWCTHTTPALEQANSIAEKFCAISNDPELHPTHAEAERYANQMAELNNSAQVEPINTQEIRRAIAQSRNKGAAGSDRISPKYLKEACKFPIFINALKAGLNKSLRTGIFPEPWKTAKVIPIAKATPNEYRPISLLSTMSKIFEKIIEQRIRESIENQLAPIQHGCRAGHSTTQALCRFVHNAGLAAAKGHSFGALAFDFSKAYDRVPRHRLIRKLVDLSVPGALIRLVDSWLTNRRIIVYHRGISSNPNTLDHGIPQGSALSVLLWLIFINDLGTKLDPTRSNIFVDDTLIWASATTKTLTARALQSQAIVLVDWARENKVKINWNKTQFIYNTHDKNDPPLKISGQTIKSKDLLKYLGVDFHSNNEFKTLVFDLKAIGGELKRRSALVHRLNRFKFPSSIIRKFTEGFVHAKLRYVSPLLGAEIHHTPTLDPLEKGYRAAIRTELGALFSTPIPLLYAGAQRLLLKDLIKRDTTRLILRSVAQSSLLGQEFQEWDGSGEGWTPLGTAQAVLDELRLSDSAIMLVRPIPLRVRNALQTCEYHFNYTKKDALASHANGQLIHHDADISIWCDGSFLHEAQIAGAAALWVNSNNLLVEVRQEQRRNASSSYEGELLALLTALKMIREKEITGKRIRIYTDSKSVITHLHAIGYRFRHEDDMIKECAHLLARLQETNQMSLHWIPSHKGIGFNETADFYAKLALSVEPENADLPIRLSTFNLQINKSLQASSSSSVQRKIKESHFREYPNRTPFKKNVIPRYCSWTNISITNRTHILPRSPQKPGHR
jgi:ribonuclease HI